MNRIIALDSTHLLAADSFLRPTPNRHRDPRASEAFRTVITCFCNDTALWYATPKSRPQETTVLHELWRTHSHGSPETIPLNGNGLRDIYKETARKFTALVNRNPTYRTMVVDWLKFQIDDELLTQVFWGGGNTIDDLKEASEHIGGILRSESTLWDELRLKKLPQPKGQTMDAVESFGSLGEFAICYAFHAFFKGRLYHYRIPNGPTYMPHWMREPALPKSTDEPDEVGEGMPTEFFPWGDIIHRMAELDPEATIFGPEKLYDAILIIRRSSQATNLRALFDQTPLTFEDHIIDTLRQAGWVFRGRVRKEGALDACKEIVAAGTNSLITTAITYALKSRWIADSTFQLTRRLLRGHLWRVFHDPGIQQAVSRASKLPKA